MRPGWPLPAALLCAMGVGASLATRAEPVAALVVLVVALALLAGDASGRLPLLRAVLPRRATQNVVSEPVVVPPGARVRLIVTAGLDVPRAGMATAAAPLAARLRRALGGRGPTPLGVLALAFVALIAIAVARVAGSDADWLAVAALLPTIALVVGTVLLADLAFARPAEGAAADRAAAAVADALAVVAALDRRPARHLAVECVIAGAATAGQLGLRAYVRARRRGARPQELAVLALGPQTVAGGPAFHPKEGQVLPSRLHPQLVAHAHAAGLPPRRGPSTGALAARRGGWPALGLTPADVSGHTIESALTVIGHLDGQFADHR